MKKTFQQKCRKAWLLNPEFSDWLRRDGTTPTRVYCSYCKRSINAKLCDLRAHASTQKHMRAEECFQKPSSKQAEQEIALCMFIAQHTAISETDHLSHLCILQFGDSMPTGQIMLGKTKCANLMKNVIAPHFSDDLRSDIGESKFSLLLDEISFISVTKLLGIVINYFSKKRGRIITTFLCLVPMENGDAQYISGSIKKELLRLKLNIKNLIGIGTDNSDVMAGQTKSVFTELRKDVPFLVSIKCVCHSVQLALNEACKQYLPECLEFLVYETYNWFFKTSLRKIEYNNIYQAINNDMDPLKIPSVTDPRWLSIESAVTRILDHWLELKVHFSVAANQEKCRMAEILHSMFEDNANYLYLVFLKPILSDMEKINKCFQSNSTNPTELLNDLLMAINSLKKGIIPDGIDVDVIKEDDFERYVVKNLYQGYEFEKQVKKFRMDEESQKLIRECCVNFTVELIKQLKQRLPDNFNILTQIDIFSVTNILRPKKQSIVPILMDFDVNDIPNIERQYNNINLVKWENTDDTSAFWCEVLAFKDSGGSHRFLELAAFAIQMLSLPWSNAEVERIFGQVNIIKSMLKSETDVSTLNAILCIRNGLRRHGKCCVDYEVPHSYLRLIGTTKDKDYGNDEIVHLDSIIKELN